MFSAIEEHNDKKAAEAMLIYLRKIRTAIQNIQLER